MRTLLPTITGGWRPKWRRIRSVMGRFFLGITLVAAACAQEHPEIPIDPLSAVATDKDKTADPGKQRLSSDAARGVVDPKVRELMRDGAGSLRVFVVLRRQPHREILERYERPARLKFEILEGRIETLSKQILPSDKQLAEARADLEREMLEVRQAAFREIEAEIGPEQDGVAHLVARLGGRNLQRYKAINMLAAEVPASAIDMLASHPSIAEIALVEQQKAQLAVSAFSLGAPVFWAAGYTGGSESVAVMDTGIRTSHPAFSGLNIISKVFLENAKKDPCFGDDAASPEDKQGHGTHVAGIVASRGAPGWSGHLGVARGLGTLYNLKSGYFDKCSGGSMNNAADVAAAFEWATQQLPTLRIFNYSYGGDARTDDDIVARVIDYFADTYNLAISISAGNETKSALFGLWTNPGPVSSPGIAHNVLTVAAMNTQGTIDRRDDEIAIFSSRGPTIGGRKKPDIAAPGGLHDIWVWRDDVKGWIPDKGIYSADYASSGFVAMPGTSMAAPHIAGAAALLRQAGVKDPLAIKALLLNSTDQRIWDNDQGWGYANLGRAFDQRNNWLVSSVSSGRVRLFKGTANGLFYSTLTWNRTVSLEPFAACLSNLDLSIYNGSTGALLSSSASRVDNVEKAYATTYGPVVVNVGHWSQGSCRSPENFGLAFSDGGFQPATGPALNVSCTAPASVAPGARFSATCTIRNRGDLPAFSVQGALSVSGGSSTVSQDFGTILPGGSASRTWLVTASSSIGAFTLQLAAQSNSFGGIFSGSGSVTFSTSSGTCTVAASPASINMPAAGGSGSLNVTAPAGCSWQAVSNSQWITVTSGMRGSGNGTVVFTVSSNTGSSTREGTITVGGQSVTVTQAGVSGGPTIASVVNGASFQLGISAGAWISIFGSNLANTARLWRNDEIINGVLPTQLDGVRVTINGKPAAISYISPTQLNVQVPADDATGPVEVRVANANGNAIVTAVMLPFAPGLFVFDADNRRYVAAQHAGDYSLVGRPGLYPGSAPAKPGEVVIFYGTGFGPTAPPSPAGRVITSPALLANEVRAAIGGIPAQVLWSGLIAAGLYQFNIKIPEGIPNGDAAVTVAVAGWPSQANTFLTVQR